jgi:hypothetical protein
MAMADDDERMHDDLPPEALLAGYPPPMQAIAEELRSIVRAARPDAIERVRPGWRLIGYDLAHGKRRTFFAWVAAETKHAHLGFKQGWLMRDPDRLLDGRGITKQARWLTFRAGDPLDPARLTALVHEAARIAELSPAELVAAAFEADAASFEAEAAEADAADLGRPTATEER